jgi:hypothetical protein
MHAHSHKLLALMDAAAPHLARMTDADTLECVRAGGWSYRQTLGHLIDSASNNHQRFVRASLQKELNFPGYDQNGNVRSEQFQKADWAVLVDAFTAYNRFLAHVIAHLPEDKLKTLCRIGANPPTNLEQLVRDYVRNIEQHLRSMGIEPQSAAA